MGRIRRTILVVWHVLSLRCEQADRIRTESISGDPSRGDRIAESLHRVLCGSCRKARRQLLALQESLRDLESGDAGPGLSEEARGRIAMNLEKSSDGV